MSDAAASKDAAAVLEAPPGFTMPRTVLLLVPLAVLVFWPALSSGRDEVASTANQTAETRASSTPTKDVLATVNGIPIGEIDVRFKLKNDAHSAQVTPQSRQTALETLIREELFSQRAVELGLDADPGYQEKLRQMEAQMNAFKRKELAQAFVRSEIEGKALISEAEARAYFTGNAARIRTELHVWQIMRRGEEDSIKQALKDIENGTPFEEVAEKQFPKLPAGQRPWDLGYLRWRQVPEPWLSVVYDLKKGEVSGLIRGPKSRFWIIKLIDKRENPDINFDSVRPIIIEVLKTAKIQELRERLEQDLRRKADVVYTVGKPGDVIPSVPGSSSD